MDESYIDNNEVMRIVTDYYGQPHSEFNSINVLYNDGESVFSLIKQLDLYDLLSSVKVDELDYLTSISGEFNNIEDIILNAPAFEPEQTAFMSKRIEEERVNVVEDSIYTCSKCNAPVQTITRQTRSADEGVTVMVVCQACNITQRR